MKNYIPNRYNLTYNKTWIFDLDGTILEYEGLQNKGLDKLLPGVQELWSSFDEKDMIILITGRPSSLKQKTLHFLNECGIRYDFAIFDAPFGERTIINDFKNSGAPTAFSWNVFRNAGFTI